ncbi:MAG: hypothetical protein ACJ76S_12170 [Solirubrobacteraceae bacterium]|jgi:hypothetical protein
MLSWRQQAWIEAPVQPTALQYRLLFGAMGKRYLRRIAEQTIDGLRAVLGGRSAKV